MNSPTGNFSARRTLLRAAVHSERALAWLPDDHTAAHHRARDILTGLAQHCRTAADALLTDPTLATEPDWSARFRTVTQLADHARDIVALLRGTVFSTPGPDHHDQRWDEIETLYQQARHLAAAIPEVVPRHDHNTIPGSQAISLARLAIHHAALSGAAATIRHALVAAAALPYPDPRVTQLTALARQLDRHAIDLHTHHHTHREPRTTAAIPTR
ncbi:hypothetical protein [Amycolatopsis anabasis]|uniref:hypothetical protein n=1 Tax=Amycolatopsis anabasis TaxID=1840409 RepID=UPI00131A8BF5|nr:hypothetical protein [Amycolatopsis anabasis]